MNCVSLVGRFVRDPEVRYSTGENANASCRFTIAVQRKYKNPDGTYGADFISCVAFRQTAEFIAKYFKQGSLIGINGEIRTGNYTNKEGQKIYTTDVIVNNVEFVGSKSMSEDNSTSAATKDTSFMDVPDTSEESFPWE